MGTLRVGGDSPGRAQSWTGSIWWRSRRFLRWWPLGDGLLNCGETRHVRHGRPPRLDFPPSWARIWAPCRREYRPLTASWFESYDGYSQRGKSASVALPCCMSTRDGLRLDIAGLHLNTCRTRRHAKGRHISTSKALPTASSNTPDNSVGTSAFTCPGHASREPKTGRKMRADANAERLGRRRCWRETRW